MVSTPSALLRLNKQAVGDNVNTWGSILNTQVFDLLEAAIAGVRLITMPAGGLYTLSSANYGEDDARFGFLKVTGPGGVITIPSSSKSYGVLNQTTGTLRITAGGAYVEIAQGKNAYVVCDGAAVYLLASNDTVNEKFVNDKVNAGNDALTALQTQLQQDIATAVANVQAGGLTAAQQTSLALVNTLFANQTGIEGKVLTGTAANSQEWRADDDNTVLHRWRFT